MVRLEGDVPENLNLIENVAHVWRHRLKEGVDTLRCVDSQQREMHKKKTRIASFSQGVFYFAQPFLFRHYCLQFAHALCRRLVKASAALQKKRKEKRGRNYI